MPTVASRTGQCLAGSRNAKACDSAASMSRPMTTSNVRRVWAANQRGDGAKHRGEHTSGPAPSGAGTTVPGGWAWQLPRCGAQVGSGSLTLQISLETPIVGLEPAEWCRRTDLDPGPCPPLWNGQTSVGQHDRFGADCLLFEARAIQPILANATLASSLVPVSVATQRLEPHRQGWLGVDASDDERIPPR
jgi:hypothetical protein